MSEREFRSAPGEAPAAATGVARTGGLRPDVGRKSRRWRQTRGLTLAQVGERSGLNVGYLSQIENDKAVPSLDALAAIADALEVPPAWLFLDSARGAAGRPVGDRSARPGPTARRWRRWTAGPRATCGSSRRSSRPAVRPASTPTRGTSTT